MLMTLGATGYDIYKDAQTKQLIINCSVNFSVKVKALGGTQYAIAFNDGLAAIPKTATLSIEIFLRGNNTGKANKTVSLKVNVLK